MLKYLLLIIFTCFLLNIYAQPSNNYKKIEGVAKNSFRTFGSIINKENNDVFGHIVCYQEKGKLIAYFLDTDLNKKRKIDIRVPRGFKIKDAMLNGESFLILIGNHTGKTIAYTYTLAGEKISVKRFAGNHAQIALLPSPDDNCYYSIQPAKGYKKRYGYEVQKLDTGLSVVWEKRFFPEEKGTLNVETANYRNNKLIIGQTYKPNDITQNISAELLCLNSMGDTVFVSALKDEKSLIIPSKITFDNSNNIVTIGQVYQSNTRRNIFSTGIFIKKTSFLGTDVNMKTFGWHEGIQKHMRKSQLALSGTSRLYLHDLFETKNGEFYAIGETYSTSKVGPIFEYIGENQQTNKYIETAAFARKLITYFEAKFSGRYIGDLQMGYASTITTQDLVVFNFGSDLNLNDVQKVKKDYTKVYAFPPYTLKPGIELSKILAKTGFFDYSYTTKSINENNSTVIYSSAYCTEPHIGYFTVDGENEIKAKTIPYNNFKDKSRKAAKRNIIKNNMAGAVPSNDGKIVVYFYLENKKANKENSDDAEKNKSKERKKKKSKGKKKSKNKIRKKGAIYYYETI